MGTMEHTTAVDRTVSGSLCSVERIISIALRVHIHAAISRYLDQDGRPFFVATVLELPECTAHGPSEDEAAENIVNSLRSIVSSYLADKSPIPFKASLEIPSEAHKILRIPVDVQPAADIYR